ncbi:MAG TPA: NADPH-dependent F420 reductase [Bryobacteraceae bacterium]|nr:NADPH-dependent F420 reductase [Bryobacteraceae bacterium]
MTIAIIGSGNVGGALGRRWARAGHQVIFGSRDPGADDLKKLVAESGANARAATLEDAAKAGEILLFAMPWPPAKQILELLGDLSGKILIDTTNPLKAGLSGLDVGTTTSAAEQVAQWARGAKVVKAFNTVGANVMASPAFGSERPVMFYCGDDSAAKAKVKPLIDELGFDAIDAGPLTQSRTLEPMALLWISLAYQQGQGREIAFKLMRR